MKKLTNLVTELLSKNERKFNYLKHEIKYDEINKHINMKIDDLQNDKNKI